MKSMSRSLDSKGKYSPLVSCVMPTFNRRKFVPQAIGYFLRQDYFNRELIIVDDGTDSVQDLVPGDSRIHYMRLDNKFTIGAKRNLACKEAIGEIIVHWDDDDWHAPYRIRYQAENLIKNEADICGNDRLLFYDLKTQVLWRYEFPNYRKIWMAGGSLCYAKSFWQEHKFDDTSYGEDTRFIWKKPIENAIVLTDYRYYVAMIHPGNTCPKSLTASCWKRWHADDVQSIINGDWEFYSQFRYI